MLLIRFQVFVKFACLYFTIAHCAIAHALESTQPKDFLTEEDYFTEMPKVVSATRLAQHPSDTPASITVIDRRMIEASGVTDIADILRLVPGFQVTHANGNIYAVTSHGLAFEFPRKLQILIDGRSVYRPLLSNIDWTNLGIAIADIERIEVIRGPNAPSYGTNAFLGTVNIITRQPFTDNGLFAQRINGDIGLQQTTARFAHVAENFSARFTLETREDNGFDNVDDRRDAKLISFRSVYDVNPNNSIDMQAGINKGDFGAWGTESALDPVREKEIDTWYYFFRWTRHIQADEEFNIQFYRNHYRQHDDFSIGPLSDILEIPAEVAQSLFGQLFINGGIYDGMADRFDVEFEHVYPFDRDHRIVWGAGLRTDSFKSLKMLDHTDSVEDHGERLFANLEWWPADKSIFNLGAMLEHNELMGTKLSPRVGYNYHLNHQTTLRASATRAYRSPSLFEAHNLWLYRLNDGKILNTIFASDPALKEEKIQSYELGYLVDIPAKGVAFDIKIFREEIDDLITAPKNATYPDSDFNLPNYDINDGVKVWTNGGHAVTDGIELQLIYRPTVKTTLNAQCSFARIEGEILSNRNPDQFTSVGNDVPRVTASILLDHLFRRGWRASLMTFYMDEMRWEGDGHFVDAYTRVDARVAKRTQFGEAETTFAVNAQNLLDEEYNEFSRLNVFERRLYFSLAVKM